MKKLLPIRMLTLATVLFISSCSRTNDPEPEAIHWDYEHPNWGTLGYTDCDQTVQSPLNIETATTVKATLEDIKYAYSAFNFKIIDNGHTIQVNNNGTNSITLNNTKFTFLQFHFHHKSEHTIDGKASPLEVHLVHQDEVTKNLTVIGIMLEEGTKNTFIDKIWANIPTTKEQEIATTTSINLTDILPVSKKYYTYTGSLTTPPCSQGVQWVLMKETVKMSKEQIDKFASIYANNARPIQKLNNRLILEKTN